MESKMEKKGMKQTRREFLKTAGAGVLSFATVGLGAIEALGKRITQRTRPEMFFKGFWVAPRFRDNYDEMCRRMAEVGSSKIWPLVESLNQDDYARFVDAAHKHEIEFHAWMINNKPEHELMHREFMLKHKDWYVVNKNGVSSVDSYLFGTYPWMCPTSEEFRRYQLDRIANLVANPDIDGLHLDFIRYPDTFRIEGRRSYEREEVPEYSFCYCDRCRRLYYEEKGVDPIEIELKSDNPQLLEWKQWRYQQIVKEVQEIRKHLDPRFKLSAAVFPTPEISRKDVLQDWPAFADQMDHLCTMIYTPVQWGQPISWVEEATRQGVKEIKGKCKLYSGFGHLVEERRPGELREGILAAHKGGADGALIFRYPGPTPAMMKEIREVNEEIAKGK